MSSTSPEKRIFLLYTLLLVAQSSYQFFHRNKILFAGFHILQHCFAFIHFVLSYDSYERNTLGIGKISARIPAARTFASILMEKAASLSPKFTNINSVPFTASFG